MNKNITNKSYNNKEIGWINDLINQKVSKIIKLNNFKLILKLN